LGRGQATLDVFPVETPLRSVSDNGTSFAPAPSDTAAIRSAALPNDVYDSIFVIWDPDTDAGDSIPTTALAYMELVGGGTYATIPTLGWWTRADACDGEVFVHEWLHG